MERYFIIYKPAGMVSQFVSPDNKKLLGDLDFPFPEGTQAVGRLDEDSEGLLILTTDKTLVRRLLHPDKRHLRKYLVYVKGDVNKETLQALSSGIGISVQYKGDYTTLPCSVRKVDTPSYLPPMPFPYKEYMPHSWLEFTLTEGKKRQIRKMCLAVKHRCKRLIRTHIEDLDLGTLQPGEVKEMEKEELFLLLKL